MYARIGDLSKAVEHSIKALEIANKITDQDTKISALTDSLTGLGIIYDKLGDHRRAIDYYKNVLSTIKELPLSKQMDHISTTIKSYINLAAAYNSLAKFQMAMDYYAKASEEAKKNKALFDSIRLDYYINSGLLHNSLGDAQTAINNFNLAISLPEFRCTACNHCKEGLNSCRLALRS